MDKKIRILVIDDHPLMRFSVSKIIQGASEIDLVAEGDHGSQLLTLLVENDPVDLVLLDLHMSTPPAFIPEVEIDKARKKFPDLKIIAFSGDDSVAMIQQIIMAGASGYLLKDSDEAIKELPAAIRTVVDGSHFYSQRVLHLLMQAVPAILFSPREQELIGLLVNGASNYKIAKEISVSVKTVEHHLQVIGNKLALPSGEHRKEINIRTFMARKLIDMGYR